MSLLQATILGIIQGLTEFLPVSSSGHLIILPTIFNWEVQSLAFDVALHVGTLTAVLFYFRSDIIKLATGIIRYRDQNYRVERRFAFLIILGIIPAGFAGFLFERQIEHSSRSITIVIANLVIWGLFLIAADLFTLLKKTHSALTPLKALIIGFFQVLSLIPGTSRSGITIGAGIFTNISKKEAARFSFLMSIPLITAAGILKSMDLFQAQNGGVPFLPLAVGFIASALTGFFAIKLLMKILGGFGLTFFALYRVALAMLLYFKFL